MATTIQRHPEAFTGSGGKKRPRKQDGKHLDFIRSLPCVITGKRPVEAAHIRYADLRYGKHSTGMAEKPDDRWAVPLSPEMHREQHGTNEAAWWKKQGIDPMPIALALKGISGDTEAGETIIRLIARKT